MIKKTGQSRPVLKLDRNGMAVARYNSAREAAMKNHMSLSAVVNRCNGRVKRPFNLNGYNFQWEELARKEV